jgi:DNA (cytosine-5)-methyltransferase 1
VKVLNLYAGIGGNRKLWDGDIEVTAVEINPKIAKIYQDFFPNDKVIVGDAHKYLLEHFEEFDFIWSSPPCPTHSKVCKAGVYSKKGDMLYRPKYPDMKLYEEILFLKGYFKGKYVIENVIGWYEPLIKPYILGSHYFWSNFPIIGDKYILRNHNSGIDGLSKTKGFDITGYSGIDKIKTLRNCVNPLTGKYVFDCAFRETGLKQWVDSK